jgi:hypothetical protein
MAKAKQITSTTKESFPLRDNKGVLKKARVIIKHMKDIKPPSLNTYILNAINEYNQKHGS